MEGVDKELRWRLVLVSRLGLMFCAIIFVWLLLLVLIGIEEVGTNVDVDVAVTSVTPDTAVVMELFRLIFREEEENKELAFEFVEMLRREGTALSDDELLLLLLLLLLWLWLWLLLLVLLLLLLLLFRFCVVWRSRCDVSPTPLGGENWRKLVVAVVVGSVPFGPKFKEQRTTNSNERCSNWQYKKFVCEWVVWEFLY